MTDERKIRCYEHVLHMIQLHAEVTMDRDKLSKVIRAVCDWSYAHRAGNGELSDEEVDEQIQKQFEKLEGLR